ncbi:hypothetical protein A3Q56_03186 [Intoshia linei]|uniref:SH3 domain-containing protein n=1 Tax=Intoshia linei TaxID=1819745 RepID=A0A177B432_9BILA|nr:hypothetical protein A3Q56_03186 [Intoshia linei]
MPLTFLSHRSFPMVGHSTLHFISKFRSFNEPLFTFENYENIIKAAKHSNKEQQIDLILVCLDSMNQIHYQSVKCVFHHFYRIYIKSKKNKGFLNDISMIFGSILINSKIQSLTTLINAKFSNSIFESELKNSDTNSLEKIDNLKNSNLDLSTSSSFFKFSESRNNSINNEINTPKPVRPSPLPPTSNSFNKQDSFDQDQALKSPKPRQVPPIPQRVQKQQTLDVVEPKTPTLEINRKFSVDCKKNKKQKKKSKEENSYLKTVYITSRAVTLFQCKAERDEELSFHADILLTKIKPSVELGWYVATDSDNNTGLVPENYIKFI